MKRQIIFILMTSCVLGINPPVVINEGVNISPNVSLSKLSGDNQQALVNTTLAQSFIVKLSYANGGGD